MAWIISASRRTDIPRYFGAWFQERRRAGFADYRNAFGMGGRASLRDEDVLGYLFWTKFARPFAHQLRALRDDGVPYAFQYTINGYGRDIEAHIPSSGRAVDDFLEISGRLPDPACIEWRYDPIVLSDTYGIDDHLRRFEAIARALDGATRVVNTSIVEPYVKAVRRVADPTVRFRSVDPVRHRTVARRHPDLPQVGPDVAPLLEALASIAAEHGMELRCCCNPEWELPPAQCCGVELFSPYGGSLARQAAALEPGPSRASCRCLRTVDIGMDNTCVGGCKYCYVVTSQESAVANFRRHDPTRPTLR